MNIFKGIKINKLLKEIEPEVDKELIEMGLLKIENGKKDYALGSVNVKMEIEKRLLKEKYNIDYQTYKDKHPEINMD